MKDHSPSSKPKEWTPRFDKTDRSLIVGNVSPYFNVIFGTAHRQNTPVLLHTAFSPMEDVSINFTVNPGLKTETARKCLKTLGFHKSFIDSYVEALSGSGSTPERMRNFFEGKGYEKRRIDLLIRQLEAIGTIREDRNQRDAHDLIKLRKLKVRIPRTQWELWFSILRKLTWEKLKEMLTSDLKNRDKWERRLKREKKNWSDVYLTENAIAEITSELSGEPDAGAIKTKLNRYQGIKISLAHYVLLTRLATSGNVVDEILGMLMGQ